MRVAECFKADLLKGTTVFVTGGGSGINFGVARNFAAMGADIGLCGRTQEKLDKAAEELEAMGVRTSAVAADVRDYEALEASMAACRDKLGPISVLIAGAAGNFPCAAEKLTANGFKTVVDIDLLGSFNACRAAYDQLLETQGSIIFISAGQAYIPYAWQAHVGAAKAGVENLMRNLALEWGPQGIRSNCIVPGPINDTEGVKRLMPAGAEEKFARIMPLQRFGSVDDIGQMAVFLASPLAAYVTGGQFIVDGGMNLPGSGAWTHLMAKAMSG